MSLAEWLYEDGIGEERAMLVDRGKIIEARIERRDGIKAGLIARAQLVKQLVPGKRGIARLMGDHDVLLSPLPKDVTEGASLMVEVTRAAINERTRFKLPLGKAAPEKMGRPAPTLLENIGNDGIGIRHCRPHEADIFAEYGWNEILEEARSGQSTFPGGSLIISVTAAMTLIDVDGDIPEKPLALAAVVASAHIIRRLNLQGSIGIDFPNLEDKADRQAVAQLLDREMHGPFERTAMNGFGFLQLVTRRTGPSLPEILQNDPVAGFALGLLRSAERNRGAGPMILVAHPAIIGRLDSRPEWTGELSRNIGRPVSLRGDAKLPIGHGYVE